MLKPFVLIIFFMYILSFNAQAERKSSMPYRSIGTAEIAIFQDELEWFLDIGLQTGGDNLGEIENVETGEIIDKIRAGGFVSVRSGMTLPIYGGFGIKAEVGVAYDWVYGNVSNSGFEFYVGMADLLVFHQFGRHRFALGAGYQFNPKAVYEAEAVFDDDNPTIELAPSVKIFVNFEDTEAFMAEYTLSATEDTYISIRYTHVEYSLEENNQVVFEADGSSTGIIVGYRF